MNQLLAANSNQPGNRFSNKEVMNNWKAQNWVPEKLVALYKRLGTQYFFAMANHHDNLDLLNIPVRGDGTIDEKEIAIWRASPDGWILIRKAFLIPVYGRFIGKDQLLRRLTRLTDWDLMIKKFN